MKLFTKLDCVRCHDFIVYSFPGSRGTGKIAGKRSSRALTSRILRPSDCCMAENVPCQQTKKAWSTAPPLTHASLQISFSPAPLRLCIPLLVVVFIFYKWRLKCPPGCRGSMTREKTSIYRRLFHGLKMVTHQRDQRRGINERVCWYPVWQMANLPRR